MIESEWEAAVQELGTLAGALVEVGRDPAAGRWWFELPHDRVEVDADLPSEAYAAFAGDERVASAIQPPLRRTGKLVQLHDGQQGVVVGPGVAVLVPEKEVRRCEAWPVAGRAIRVLGIARCFQHGDVRGWVLPGGVHVYSDSRTWHAVPAEDASSIGYEDEGFVAASTENLKSPAWLDPPPVIEGHVWDPNPRLCAICGWDRATVEAYP